MRKIFSVTKLQFILTICFFTFSSIAVFAASGKKSGKRADTNFIAKMEKEAAQQFRITKDNFLKEIAVAKKEIAGLRGERKRVLSNRKALSISEQKGTEFFKKYQSLIKLRAADENGAYDPATQLSQVDIDNINRLFKYFLNSIPLKGRVVVGIADQKLAEGLAQLNKLIETHQNPTEDNDSDLAIIKSMEDKLLAKIKVIETLGNQYDLFRKKK